MHFPTARGCGSGTRAPAQRSSSSKSTIPAQGHSFTPGMAALGLANPRPTRFHRHRGRRADRPVTRSQLNATSVFRTQRSLTRVWRDSYPLESAAAPPLSLADTEGRLRASHLRRSPLYPIRLSQMDSHPSAVSPMSCGASGIWQIIAVGFCRIGDAPEVQHRARVSFRGS